MASTTLYRQCRLVKKLEARTRHQTSYLPEKFAVPGKVLRLKDAEGAWEDGWVVEAASESRVSEELLPDPHRDVKRHRRNTGDSLPKEGPRDG